MQSELRQEQHKNHVNPQKEQFLVLGKCAELCFVTQKGWAARGDQFPTLRPFPICKSSVKANACCKELGQGPNQEMKGKRKSGVVCRPVIPTLGRPGDQEFKVVLGSRVSSQPA